MKKITWKTTLQVLNICKAKFAHGRTLDKELNLFKLEKLSKDQIREAFRHDPSINFDKQNINTLNSKFEFMFFSYLSVFDCITKIPLNLRECYTWTSVETPGEYMAKLLTDAIFSESDDGLIIGNSDITEEIKKIKKMLLPFFKVVEVVEVKPAVSWPSNFIKSAEFDSSKITAATKAIINLFSEIKSNGFNMTQFERENRMYDFGRVLSEMNIVKYSRTNGWDWIFPGMPDDSMITLIVNKIAFNKSVENKRRYSPENKIKIRNNKNISALNKIVLEYLVNHKSICCKTARILHAGPKSMSASYKLLTRMTDKGQIIRTGRNQYTLPTIKKVKQLPNPEVKVQKQVIETQTQYNPLYDTELYSFYKTTHTKNGKIIYVLTFKRKIEKTAYSKLMTKIRTTYNVGYSHFTNGFNFSIPITEEAINEILSVLDINQANPLKKNARSKNAELISIIKSGNEVSKAKTEIPDYRITAKPQREIANEILTCKNIWLKNQGTRTDLFPLTGEEQLTTRKRLSLHFKMSETNIDNYLYILEHKPELFEDIDKRKLSVDGAISKIKEMLEWYGSIKIPSEMPARIINETYNTIKNLQAEEGVSGLEKNTKLVKLVTTEKLEKLILDLNIEKNKYLEELDKTEEKIKACLDYVEMEKATAQAKVKMENLLKI